MNKSKILALLLAVVMICSLFVSPALAAEEAGEPVAISDTAAPKFTDVDGHWAESAIYRWAEEGIVEGDGDGTVNPQRNLKRAELATILTRLLGLKATAPADTFSDVAANAWYADAVLKCAQAGIMLGDGTGKANPEAPIDRQQAIVMIGRALGVKPASGDSLNRFDDADAVAEWAAPYMTALTSMGILNGLPEGDGFVLAPETNINRASTFVMLDKAIAQYITAPCTVTVDDANKFVVINSSSEEAGTVTVVGSVSGVVIAVGTTDEVVFDKATVSTVKVDAPVDVTIARGSSVADLDMNAAAKVDNKGTVTNLNTNADDVVFDGNKPAKVNTAEGVEPAKDSKGNEVTDKPASSGGSGGSSSTTYKYNVSIPATVGGKVTADVTRTNTADTVVTLTVTPDAQTATALPYVLKSLTVKNGENEVTVTNNKFTMAEEGTYTVTAEFVQPITEAVMYVANGTDKTAADMEADGYTPAGDVTDETLKDYPYFFVAMTKGADGYTVSEMKLTANGADVTLPWTPAIWKFASAYVGSDVPEIDPNGENADKLNFTGSAATFVFTFKIDTAEYEFSCDYVKPGVDASTLHTVTFKTSTGTELATYKAVATEKVTVPAAPAIDGYYFTAWSDGLTSGAEYTVGDADKTITAEYVEIGDQELKTRPNGPANNGDTGFDYAAAYEAAGVTFTGTAGDYTYTIDAATFLNYAATPDNKLSVLAAEVNGKTYYFYGAAIMAPADAATLVLTKDNALTSLDDAAKRTEFDLETSEHSFTIGDQKCILHYFGAVAEQDAQGVYGFQPDGVFVRYAKWVDSEGNIITVNKIVLNRKTTPAKLNVTFKADGETVETKTVDYNAAIGELPAVPAKVGYTGAWKDVDAETKITADTEVVAEYTPIVYAVYVGDAETAEEWTVAGKVGAEPAQTNLVLSWDEKPGWFCGGWNYKASAEAKGEKFADGMTATVAAADLPKYAHESADGKWNVIFVPDAYIEVGLTDISAADITAICEGTVFANGLNAEAIASYAGEDVGFDWDNAAVDENGFTVLSTQVVLEAFQYTGFGTDSASKDSYYLAFAIGKPQDVEGMSEDVVIRAGTDTSAKAYQIKLSDMTDKLDEHDAILIIMYVGDETKKADEINIYVDWDGVSADHPENAAGKFKIKLTDANFKPIETTPATPDQSAE